MHKSIISIVLFCLLSFSNAELGAQVYSYTDQDGNIVLTNKKPSAKVKNVQNHGCFGVCIKEVNWQQTPLKTDAFASIIETAAIRHDIDASLLRAIMHAESWFQVDALSKAGAQGLMQLMPATQQRFKVKNPYDPNQNINAGAQYLAWLLSEFKFDVRLAISAYNAGENAVKRYRGIPPFEETREYLRRVEILHKRYANQARYAKN